MPKVIIEKKKASAPKRKVKSFRVHKADNGFVVHHEMHSPKTKTGMFAPYEPEQQNVFEDQQGAQDHVNGLMGQM